MNRRELLTTVGVALSTAGLVLHPNLVRAQDRTIASVVENVVRNQNWAHDHQVYARLRWGAYYYHSLEKQFDAPKGTLVDDTRLHFLQDLLPLNSQVWLDRDASRAHRFVQDNENELVDAIITLYQGNFLPYLAWLDSLGILASGPVSNGMLSGQAFATLVSLSGDYSNYDPIMDRIDNLQRCFFPFCRR